MTDLPYQILQPSIHTTEWDPQLQQAVPGWRVRAIWRSTGAVIPVFVPDDRFTAANVDILLRAAGAVQDEIAGLGRA